MDRNLWIIFFVTIAALLLGRIALYGPEQQTAVPPVPEALQNLLLAEPRPLAPFSLRDHNEQPLGLAQLKGEWSFIFFGYTHCPDICPTTLGTLKGVAKRLAQDPAIADSTRFLFVSLDPKRDTLPRLKEYTTFFHPAFLSATGERSELDGLLRQLGGIYMFEGDTSGSDYLLNHTASIALIDPQGRWVARFLPPLSAEKMHDGYVKIRNHLQPPLKDAK